MARSLTTVFCALSVGAASKNYDYIVVGSGSGGSPLAAKLATAGKSVLLLEAGPDSDWKGHDVAGHPYDPMIPRDVGYTLYSPEMDDAVLSEPVWQTPRVRDPRFCSLTRTDCKDPLEGRREFMPRARIVGGCTMHNWMIQLRPSPEIFEAWGEGWEWEKMLPKLKAMEHNVETGNIDAEYHGFQGDAYASNVELYGADHAFLEAAQRVGHPSNTDFNGATRVGVGPFPKSIINGSRWGSAQAWLTPRVRALSNFELQTRAFVTRVDFEGKRAVGVTYVRRNRTETARASKEVILAAGAFRSPQLLMLSGVGPQSLFDTRPKLPKVAVSEGVGRNLQDHLMWGIPFGVLDESATIGVGRLPRRDYDSAPLGGFFFSSWCRSRGCSYPDMQFMCGSAADVSGEYPGWFSCTIGLTGQIQSAPGWLTLKSLDPAEYPAIFPNYLGAKDDIDRIAEGVKHFVTDIMRQRQDMFNISIPFLSMEWYREAVRAGATTIYHPVGTAKMGSGSDPLAVVDLKLKVRGVQGLRVADASVMPLIPNVNTDLATRLIGYHLADLILEEPTDEVVYA
mmetsp:Transcript_98578/g.307029  ORF Transcript_98578/g.307029 Transcript_98578/m.307029 type:complete len:566 (-) Transcript_98578:126-1823(-)|eukprot:CAMPEP_0204522408 /NCGR_PEP_ID=MMETSP0661-20131031/6304_1 /ASSEMBLY_ACC=CAM_ASM_000606 /TAXON_ID=109239 /ORGANISM="Alexandrium margalefi, Strain AMGDE01CS-322" /LENGTH=565 /DNA_ID=CAMNT_0051528073 /DNA_START=47 /DNA_END=1744 /DNA_ORIENTATION=-